MKKQSHLIEFLKSVFSYHQRLSYEDLNHSLRKSLIIAIRGHFQINEGDWGIIASEMRYGYWGGTSSNGFHLGEGHYMEACIHHRKAAIEYERYYSRKPFILKGTRIYCGTRLLDSDGMTWKLNSFSESNDCVNLLSEANNVGTGKKRMKISYQDWQSLRKQFRIIR